jgi:hypothetical protein
MSRLSTRLWKNKQLLYFRAVKKLQAPGLQIVLFETDFISHYKLSSGDLE